MIVLYILLGIIAFIVIVLHFSVRVRASAASGKPAVLEVRWLFIKIYPRSSKKKDGEASPQQGADYTEEQVQELIRQADSADVGSVTESTPPDESGGAETEQTGADVPPEQEAASGDETESNENSDDSEKKEGGLAKLKRYYALAKPYIPTTWKYFRKLLKSIRFTKLDVTLLYGKDDAYEAAMAYGKLNAALYGAAAFLSRVFTVRVKNLRAACRFNERIFEYDASAEVLVRPSALIAIAFCLGVNFLIIFIKQKLKARRERRRAKRAEKINKKSKINETELLTNE